MENLECALVDITFTDFLTEDIYVCCDICEYSYINNSYKPLLRIVNGTEIFQNLYFFPVINQSVKRMHVYLRNKDGKLPSINVDRLRCTLALRCNDGLSEDKMV